jgi:tRNA A37 methylthiotransferase MiaB
MPNQVNRAISKERVRIINNLANQNRAEFMQAQIGKTVQVLVEENNIARCPHDIGVSVGGCPVAARTICDVELIGLDGDNFIGRIC